MRRFLASAVLAVVFATSGLSADTHRFVPTQFYNTFTPVDDERFVLHSRLHTRDSGSAEINEAIGKAFTERFMFEVEQDLKVLDYKRHLVKPRLCAGDGPIHQYRKYAAEFFVD